VRQVGHLPEVISRCTVSKIYHINTLWWYCPTCIWD